ncbi:SGNH/GDSL hydrolase family protein [Curtobacterium sp. MCSS17_015]|uniref:SGNH/GDSL hydrolase family protein n=1 Tax=Curtobacterium sp. MCSS17_015 TaxID=2175666 RepID=UPI000DA834CD|nr:SGNH/GDSL hydrolase family protein [Curtobacterium sp. MCSS17_015]WIB25443.1 SGNH/GDSL hydrolase family protein [Curtobacterium sp. MCSS17_015]
MGNGFVAWFARSYKGIIVVLVAIMAIMMVVLATQHVNDSKPAAGAEASPVPTLTSAPHQLGDKVAFIGDSYTGGTGATDKSKAFPQVLADKEGWRFTIVACGGGGYVNPGNCGSAYQDHLAEALDAKPSIVIISGGRNDTTFPAEQVRANAATTLQRVKDALPDAKIYVTSPVWDDDAPSTKLAGVQDAVKSAAEAADVDYLDIGEPLHGHPELLSADSVHPNDDGHAAIATAIAEALPAS